MGRPRRDQSARACQIARRKAGTAGLIGANVAAGLSWAEPAFAHGSERGFVMLLPTEYYLFGGSIAVAASFVLIALVPPRTIEQAAAAQVPIGKLPQVSPVQTSWASFLFLAF